MSTPNRQTLRAAIDGLLSDDSDLVGQVELARLALARDLLGLSPADQQRPAIEAFLERVAADVRTRTAPVDGPCPAGGPHAWLAVEGGHERTWPAVEVVTDEQFDGATIRISGEPGQTDAGGGPVLLRCSRAACGTERYVPFDCDVEWSM